MAKQTKRTKQQQTDKRIFIILAIIGLVLAFAFFVSRGTPGLFIDRGEDIESFEGALFDNAVLRQFNADAPPMKNVPGPQLFDYATLPDIRGAMQIDENLQLQFLDLREMVSVSAAELDELLESKGILKDQGQAFLDAQRRYNINVFYLIAHALVETGHGQSELAEGITLEEDEDDEEEDEVVYYNFFGIGAFDTAAVSEGLAYAVKEDWTSPEKAILGGAKFISENYVHNDQKQFTTYAMRWNPENPGRNQYATDVNWSRVIAEITENYYEYFDKTPRRFYRNYYQE